MSEIVRVSYTNKGTIPSNVPYANTNPSYSLTREVIVPEGSDIAAIYDSELLKMKYFIDSKLEEDFKRILALNKQQGLEEKRSYVVDGEKYYSVTAVWEEPKGIPFLEDHARLGTFFDKLFKTWATTGKITPEPFEDSPNIKQTSAEVVEKFTAWVDAWGKKIKITNVDVPIISKQFKFAGTADAIGYYEDVPAVFDAKKGKNIKGEQLEHYLEQLGAYSMPENHYDCLVICSPYSDPIVDLNVEFWQRKFLISLGMFRERYGL